MMVDRSAAAVAAAGVVAFAGALFLVRGPREPASPAGDAPAALRQAATDLGIADVEMLADEAGVTVVTGRDAGGNGCLGFVLPGKTTFTCRPSEGYVIGSRGVVVGVARGTVTRVTVGAEQVFAAAAGYRVATFRRPASRPTTVTFFRGDRVAARVSVRPNGKPTLSSI